jgi:hypothetical protein
MKILDKLKQYRKKVNHVLSSVGHCDADFLESGAKLLILIAMYERVYNALAMSAGQGKLDDKENLSVDMLDYHNQVNELGAIVMDYSKT